MIQKLRRSKRFKTLVLLLSMSIMPQLLFPPVAYGLTGGPSQPEVQSFEPVGTSEMVDLFTGDFNYNIPLLDVGGYPVNLSYHAGITMDQEASWVGLGWNINPGVILRGMRGLPDDFNGDPVKKEMNIRPNRTWGANLGIGDTEVIGGPTISLNVDYGIFYNNYRGIGYEFGIHPTIGIGDKQKGSLNLGLGLSVNSQQGINVEPEIGLSPKAMKLDSDEAGGTVFSAKFGSPYNSRAGLRALTFGASASYYQLDKATNKLKTSTPYSIPIGSSTVPTNLQTYTPQISMPMVNNSKSFHVGLGSEVKWINGKARLSGYYNEQLVLFKKQSLPGFGFLYAEGGQKVAQGLHDFNREKDGSFTKSTPSLPLTSYTFDLLNFSGHGIGGVYRPHRSDVGTVYDHHTYNFSFGSQAGVDAGGGDVGKGGVNVGYNFNFSHSGIWQDGNGVEEVLSFTEREDIPGAFQPRYEPYYFKRAGELGTTDVNFQNKYGATAPIRVEINEEGEALPQLSETTIITGNTYPVGEAETTLPIPTTNVKLDREKRNQPLGLLNVKEAKKLALEKKIPSYINGQLVAEYDRGEFAPNHHISELSAFRTDGARYVYGIPAYNISQREVSFNVTGRTKNCPDGLVSYQGNDNSIDNQNGIDHFFSATELPPFAHSYLLTAVLSADYIDRELDGPTEDDFGSYTKFCYSRYQDLNKAFDISNARKFYNWRSPFYENEANLNEGLKADDKDDKGNYIYGEKDLWYLNRIETKTHYAQFYVSPRKDGFGVKSENGGLDNGMYMYQLDSIQLFAKCGSQSSQDEMIKAVHFEYDYSLCQNVPNNASTTNGEKGKLTLKKVFFTYGNSLKGKLSPYTFEYGELHGDGGSIFNPDYGAKDYDRWGNYKENQATNCDPLASAKANMEFPYVDQNPTTVHKYATAWNLTSVNLPSGGLIKVEYEADDYAYVQDKRAMQMVTVKAIKRTPGSSGLTNRLYSADEEHLYVHLDLPEPVNNAEDFRAKYLRDEEGVQQNTVFFRFMIDVIGRAGGLLDTEDVYEYVSGYVDIEDSGIVSANEGWIKLKTVDLGDRKHSMEVNPIAKTAWQFARLYLSKKVYPGSDPNGNDESAIRSLLGFATDLNTMFRGFNRTLRRWSFGKKVKLEKSMIRLYNPTYQKYGGGNRVKKLTIGDKWSDMTNSGNDFEYGQEYSYTTIKDGSITADNPSGVVISSGVAEYEPMIGNEENPWRQPIAFSEEHRMAPSNEKYKETPNGESFFPGANVGYSKVTVRNLQHDNVKRHATGFVSHHFYTARDYPVSTSQTRLEKLPKKPSWLRRILKIDVKDYMTASQGFAIYLNDMHGKSKAQWVYPEYPENTPNDEMKPISGVEYFYRTNMNKPKRLNNEVSVVRKNGTIGTAMIGREMDVIHDMRENKTNTIGFTFAGNIDVSLFPTPPAPVPIPSAWPSFTKEETRFRSTVITKAITQYGVLEKTVAHDLGSRVSTENLAFDAISGEVLLTRTKNDFNDPVYAFTYPAHWVEQGMGSAYRNLGVLFSDVGFSNGTSGAIANASAYFMAGDELYSENAQEKLWVVEVNNNNIQVVDKLGNEPTISEGRLKIIRSGRRNMQNTPVGTLTSKKNPLVGGLNSLNASREIINVGAVEFSDQWDNFCECGINPNPKDEKLNPFQLGIAGNWRAKRSWLYLTQRDQASVNRNTYIREDGLFNTFSPFWIYNGTGDWNATTNVMSPSNSWVFSSEVTLFSPYGYELENMDALKRYSSALYGFNNTLPTAVASNARYSEIGFDSFEDYQCKTCTDDHFSFSESIPEANISVEQAHTGRRSIKVGANQQVSITKVIIPCQTGKNDDKIN